MPLFVDPKARERLTFPPSFVEDDGTVTPVVPELVGEWIEVRQSIGSSEWRDLQAGAMTVGPGRDNDGGPDWNAAFQGQNGLRRLAMWIQGASFVDGEGRPYPPQNTADRMRWLGAMWPPAGTDVDRLLSEYIDKTWEREQPQPHPKVEPSSGQDQTAS